MTTNVKKQPQRHGLVNDENWDKPLVERQRMADQNSAPYGGPNEELLKNSAPKKKG